MSQGKMHCDMMQFAISLPCTTPTHDLGRDPEGHMAPGFLQKEKLYPSVVHGRCNRGGNLSAQPLLSSPISHWSKFTQRNLTPTHYLVTSSSSSAVPQDSRLHTCRAVFYASPKMKGQPGEGGVPTDRKKAAVMEI